MVIAVGHGGQIGYTLRGLFHNFDQDFAYGSADNTSVTSILMKKPKEEERTFSAWWNSLKFSCIFVGIC